MHLSHFRKFNRYDTPKKGIAYDDGPILPQLCPVTRVISSVQVSLAVDGGKGY